MRVEPLAFGPRAHAHDHALILGTTDTGATATWLPLAEPPATVQVQTGALRLLARDAASGPATDAVSGPLWITAWVRPVPGGRAAGLANTGLVADDEQAERRPAAWAGLQAAALVLGKDLSDLRYAAVPDAVLAPLASEPMAGALLAAAFLASLTGAPVAPDAAREAGVAGMLLPDGSVLAPAAGGVRDVHQAYARLTGRRLPAPVPVPARAMAVPETWAARLGASYPAWRRALAGSWMQVLDMTGAARQPPALARLAREAERLAQEAERLRGRGAILTAQEHMVIAATHATAAAALQAMLVHIRAGDVAGAWERLRALDAAAAARLEQAREAVAARAAPASPAAIDELALRMAAHQWLLRGAGAHAAGSQGQADVERVLAADSATGADGPLGPRADRLIAAAAPAALALARAESSARRALDLIAHEPAHEPASAPNAAAPCATRGTAVGAANRDPIRHLALAHAAATAPNLPLAPELPLAPGNPGDAVHAAVARVAIEHAQMWARTDSALAPEARCARARAALAAAMLAQVEAAQLTLGQHLPADSAARARVLTGLLARAERKARQHARAAQVATGDIPVLARLEYAMARGLARPAAALDEAGQRAALERFWLSSMHAQMATILARHWPPR